MILALTPNPTIDRSLWLDRLTLGQVHRARRVHCAAGGKGMNVARAASILGTDVLVSAPLGGHTGRQFEELAAGEGFRSEWYWRASGETRNCILIHHETADSTVINEPGSQMSEDDWRGFGTHVEGLAERAGAVVFSGSHAPGLPFASLSDLARRLASGRRTVYLDTSGAALAEALRRPVGLHIKVNAGEFVHALGGQDSPREAWLLSESRRLIEQGAAMVIVTSGASGALAVARQGTWKAAAPAVSTVSSVGSGDVFLAALASSRLRGEDIPEALAEAIACGAANATTPLPGHFSTELARSLRRETRVEALATGSGAA